MRLRIAGWLMLAMVLLSILHGLQPDIPRLPAGLAAWSAGLLLFARISGLQRTQTLAMLFVGVGGMLFSLLYAGDMELEKAVASNQALLAMLTAVSFLRLVTLPAAGRDEQLPRGPSALWRTLFGVHLFGAVINLSAVMILADRLSGRQPLSPMQASVLSRGFAMASHWSPFFAAVGIALTHAPGSELFVLSITGIPVTLVALFSSGWWLTRRGRAQDFIGYPMHFEALTIPAILAVAVLIAHALAPQIPILTVITTLAMGLSLALLLVRQRLAGLHQFIRHTQENLPGMSGELSLFLAAGVLAAGISSVVQASGIDIRLEHFGPLEASLLLYLMVAVSIIGVHPVISVATAGGILIPIIEDPNLLAITFLMTWALGISTSPFSGMHLGMQGRYGIDARNFVRWNGGFALFMLLVDTLALHVYSVLRGL